MKRKRRKMVWFDDAPAEPSDGALYSAWGANEPSNGYDDNCAFLDFYRKKWNNNRCHFGKNNGPLFLCQKRA